MDLTELERKIGNCVSAELIDTIESILRWEADAAWRFVFDPVGLAKPPSSEAAKEIALTALRRGRRHIGDKALEQSAKMHGLPYSYVHVGGGHRKLFAQCGPVVLMTEAVSYVDQPIGAARYKENYAECFGALRQLILPFVEWPPQRLDVRDTVFCVLQHLIPFASPSAGDARLRSLRLIVPSVDLKSSVLRCEVTGERFRERFVAPFDHGNEPAEVDEKISHKLRLKRLKVGG